MTAPRLEISLAKITDNTATLVGRLGAKGISVTGVTKATLGAPEVARAMVLGGAIGLGDSRIENIENLRRSGLNGPMTLIRSPMVSQVARVVQHVGVSLNSELDVMAKLSEAAREQHRHHAVVLMVELGDLREGLLPRDLEGVARRVLTLPNLVLRGVGTNLACQNGVAPDDHNMAELSALVSSLESTLNRPVALVSGGNSANLDWALNGSEVGRINDLRLGESILLGLDPLHDRPIAGLHIDAFTLVGEIIEAKVKSTCPRGDVRLATFGAQHSSEAAVHAPRVIVALGHQDVDLVGLVPPAGWRVVGASSDHLVLDPGTATTRVGDEVRFQVGYRSLLRAMTSPFVSRAFLRPAPRRVEASPLPAARVPPIVLDDRLSADPTLQVAAAAAPVAASATTPPRTSLAMPSPIRFIT